ncbi:2-oxoglutarate dehydrogenase complex dihydrolipoyllysine-residue succinyltransferase [Siccirubricoccus sp. KC 17139]|uniref:Dihydrolipoyllysine-residue succinyltransferase component of 2-oxoglutarate dehydrogenase complex n=1 Tax=Siccirubricoccus soli TaxID=2899147 RepID=A0ABT1D5S0_9PROT|nr:2-oxoglutarate dehydrogenase complex dihydrolipoyllysine-residue succinyltransferase [Siccirubricoccus soli]MCO6416635.1 2-oxoglutarate dehydrogenase complex dihydrolipoyllysine-residue succinyltransferase [Siccirubricoccus soli]MCP2682770.1 2-oxoglutarate dehydrogenase complex dihydrolipoyllysine-residue succinyltransferase [Siccirubricoccus soli]
MATDILVPTLGESVSSATVARWLKKAGEAVAVDEPLVELETDKVTVEVNAPAAGVIESIAADEGAEVAPGAVLGVIGASAGAGAAPAKPQPAPAPVPAAVAQPKVETPRVPAGPVAVPGTHAPLPAAAKMMAENNVTAEQVGTGTAKDGRISKGDVLEFLARPAPAAPAAKPAAPRAEEPGEERVKMTRLRITIARRLKEAQNTAAMLTTFNEVDMGAAMALRTEYRDVFEKKHGVRLGFMSFFVKACVAALKEFPAVNAEIDGDTIIYKHFVHMGIAVGGPNGLVVPVLRNADKMGFAEIEKTIGSFGKRVRDGQLKLEEMAGGSFTITNGGIYGSLMSTPILNPPQSGILGMHKIQERPMVVNGKVEVRPMMYLALSYDHRIVDGKEAVSFLVRVKESIEDPRRLMLDI